MNRLRTALGGLIPVLAGVLVVSSPALAGTLRTWDGGGGNSVWTNALNWTDDDVPDTADEDVQVDGNPGVNVSVVNTLPIGAAYTNGYLTVDAGDTLTIAKDSAPGSASVTSFGALSNSGTLTFGGSGAGTSHGHSLVGTVLGGAGGTFNAAGGKLYAKSLTGYRRSSVLFSIPANNTNDGSLYVQNVSGQGAGKVRVALSGAGNSTFVNNGTIWLEGSGSDTNSAGNQPWALMGPSTTNAVLTLAGGGTLSIQSNLSLQPDSFAHFSGLATGTTLTNATTHTITGNGYIGWNGTDGASGNTVSSYRFTAVVNNGLIQAARSTNWSSLLVQPVGGATINASSGRMVAAGDAGTVMKLGGDVTGGAFTNNGLLEARSGSTVAFASNVVVALRGELRGAGTFSSPSNSMAVGAATLAPGNSANADGTGASTVGALAVSGNLVLSSTTTLSVQLGNDGVAGADYDTVNVSGNLTLDGTLSVDALGGYGPGVYRLFTCVLGGLTDNGMTSVPGAVIVADVGAGTVDLVVANAATMLLIR